MRNLKILSCLALATAVAVWAGAGPAGADGNLAGKKAKVLTGDKEGTYYALADSLKQALSATGLQLDIGLSGGSGENLLMTSLGAADFSLVQLDLLGVFASQAEYEKVVKRVQLVAPLYLEEVHIVVRKDANIKKFEDFKGKRINVGPGASGSYFSAYIVLKQHGIEEAQVTVDHSPTREGIAALLAGKVDAVFFTGGQPVPHFASLGLEASEAAKKIAFFNMGEEEAKRYEASDMPYYAAVISPGTYAWSQETVHTIATPCLLLANADADEEVVHEIAKTIYTQKDQLSKKHPKWAQVKMEIARQIYDGKHFPFHPGALKYLTSQK